VNRVNAGPPIPRGLARRLDRLARRAHAFHRFAHHPACSEYAGEVFLAGRRTRICRGCALASLGAVAGAGSALLVPASPTLAAGAAAALAFAAGLALLSLRARRIGKIAGRFLPASLLLFAAVSGLRSLSALGASIALAAVVSALVLVRAYRRRGPDRKPCLACPERERATPCRGYAPIVRRERAFRRRAGILLGASSR